MRRRFFVESFEGNRATLSGEGAHHLARVLRAQAGQLYELSDGRRLWLGRVESAGRDHVEFSLVQEIPAFLPDLQIALLLSVVKFDAFEWAIEKATELGVGEITPLAAARSEKGLLTAAPKRAERWEKILFEAAQQSRRLRVPNLGALAEPEAAFREADTAVHLLLSERPTAPHLKAVLEKTKASSVTLAVGPEGGWTEAEIASAEALRFKQASLGRLVLRTETAVTAALASVNYALGSHDEVPSGRQQIGRRVESDSE